MDEMGMVLGLLFGSIGGGYLIFGWKQRHGMALLAGVLLSALPLFVSNLVVLTVASVALMALPFVIKL